MPARKIHQDCIFCTDTAIARYLCRRHYDQARTAGELHLYPRQSQEQEHRICIAPGCTKSSDSENLCGMHWTRVQRLGNYDLPVVDRTCVHPDCADRWVARQLCQHHYDISTGKKSEVRQKPGHTTHTESIMHAVYTDHMIVTMEWTEEFALQEAREATGLKNHSDWRTAQVTPRLAEAIEDRGGAHVRYELVDGLRYDLLDLVE